MATNVLSPMYDLMETQCYWFAGTMWLALHKQFNGTIAAGSTMQHASTYKGIQVANPNKKIVDVLKKYNELRDIDKRERQRRKAEEAQKTEEIRESGRRELYQKVKTLEAKDEERVKALEERDRVIQAKDVERVRALEAKDVERVRALEAKDEERVKALEERDRVIQAKDVEKVRALEAKDGVIQDRDAEIQRLVQALKETKPVV